LRGHELFCRPIEALAICWWLICGMNDRGQQGCPDPDAAHRFGEKRGCRCISLKTLVLGPNHFLAAMAAKAFRADPQDGISNLNKIVREEIAGLSRTAPAQHPGRLTNLRFYAMIPATREARSDRHRTDECDEIQSRRFILRAIRNVGRIRRSP
jgi:hypothetical protein